MRRRLPAVRPHYLDLHHGKLISKFAGCYLRDARFAKQFIFAAGERTIRICWEYLDPLTVERRPQNVWLGYTDLS